MAENEVESLNIRISAETDDAQRKIDGVIQKVNRLNESVQQSMSGMSGRIRNLTGDIEKHTNAYSRLQDLAKKYPKAMKDVTMQDFNRYGHTFLEEWASATTSDKLFKGMDFEQFEQFKTEAVEIRAAFDEWKEAQESLSARFKRFIDNLKNATNHTSRFANALKRILFYRAIRAVLNELSQALKEGIGNLYQYSKYYGTDFSAAMDRAATSTLYLRNSIAAALGPALQMIIPYFERLVDWVVEGVNWLNQFFATIRGAETWTKAVKVNKEYADTSKEVAEATQEEAKAVKSLISGFDELNILEDAAAKAKEKQSAVTGANPSPLTMFEEMSMDTASESAKKWGERIKGIIDGVKKVMDDLGITFEDILKTAGLVAAALLGWKIATGLFTDIARIAGLIDKFRVPIGIILTVAGFALEAKGAYDIGKNGLNKKNLLETIGGALMGIAGMTLLFGAKGLVIGIAASVVIGIVSFMMGRYSGESVLQPLKDERERLRKEVQEALEFRESIRVHVEDVQIELQNIETQASAMKKMLDDLFRLDAKDNKTAEELRTMEQIAKRLNEMGIEVHIENGKVVESREELEKLIETFKETARTSAMTKGLEQAYLDQAEAVRRLKEAQEDQQNQNKTFYDLQKQVFDSLDRLEKSYYNVEKAGDIYGEKLVFMTTHTSKLDRESNNLVQELSLASQNLELAKEKTSIYSGAVDDATESVDYYKQELGLANEVLDETIKKTGTDYPDAVDRANLKQLFPNLNDDMIDDLLRKLNQDYPNAVSDANRQEITPKVDMSGLDKAYDELTNLQRRIQAVGDESITIVSKNRTATRTISAYAYGGYPDAGELFIAREAGPELVGQIGRKTAVANNDQIVSGISSGVRNANGDVVNALYAAAQQIIRAVNDKETNVILDGQKVSKTVTNNQNRANRVYGVSQSNA